MRGSVSLVATLLWLTSCSLITPVIAPAPLEFLSAEQLQQQLTPVASTWPAYDLTAAEWVANQPLLVNQDFNFGMAMGMQGVGVAIAAGTRINGNKELAKKLAALPPLQLPSRLSSALEGVALPSNKVAVYGFLYGQPTAQMRTVIEFYPALEGQAPQRFVHVSNWRELDGGGGWLTADGQALYQHFDKSLMAVSRLIDQFKIDEINSANKSSKKAYQLSGGGSVQRGEGFVLATGEDATIVQSITVPNTVFSFPAANLQISDPLPEQPLP